MKRRNHLDRVEICHDRHDWWSCKIFFNFVNFSWKLRVSLQNLHINMKFTHLFGEFTHPFLQRYWNFTFLIIHIEIYVVWLLAKLVPIYAFLVCKIFGPKIRSCKIFDKSHVCVRFTFAFPPISSFSHTPAWDDWSIPNTCINVV